MRKGKPKRLIPKKSAYRLPRTKSVDLDHALKAVNGEIEALRGTFKGKDRLSDAKRDIRKVLQSVVSYCDELGKALDGIGQCSNTDEQIDRAADMASRLLAFFEPISSRKFEVIFVPRRTDLTAKRLADARCIARKVEESTPERSSGKLIER